MCSCFGHGGDVEGVQRVDGRRGVVEGMTTDAFEDDASSMRMALLRSRNAR